MYLRTYRRGNHAKPGQEVIFGWAVGAFGREVALHWIARPDNPRQWHDHPFNAVRVILWGGYTEGIPDETYTEETLRKVRPLTISRVRMQDKHRIAETKGSLSLWFAGKVRRRIKFYGDGWHENADTETQG